LGDLGPVAADARALDHHVAARQPFEPAVPGRQHLQAVDFGAGGFVVDECGDPTHRPEAPEAGPSLDAESPDADGRVSER
jgi:hypothetical protein